MPPNARAAQSSNVITPGLAHDFGLDASQPGSLPATYSLGFAVIPCQKIVQRHDPPTAHSALARFPQYAEYDAPNLANSTRQVTTITVEMEHTASGEPKA
jgi:hypothetical protein